MREHRDDPKKPSSSAVENYARADHAITSNWLFWLGFLYLPFGAYLALGVGPIINLFGIFPAASPNLYMIALLSEVVIWIALPVVAAIALHYKLTENKKQ